MDSIIFDLDGTLWNSTDIVADAWTEYLNKNEHINMNITGERIRSLFGRPMPQIAEMVFTDYDKEEQLRLLVSIRAKKKDAESHGRKFGQIDTRYLKRAENLLYGELSAALGLDYDKVEPYIAQRLTQNQKQ